MASRKFITASHLTIWLLLAFQSLFLSQAGCQASKLQIETTDQSKKSSGTIPEFEVSTVKPANPTGGATGIYTYPGGKVVAGQSTLKMLVQAAFDVQAFQVKGGPGWIETEAYDIVAIPPENSASKTLNPVSRVVPMNDEQRKMLQNLLIDRFKLNFHRDLKQGSVYLLSRNGNELQMRTPKDNKGVPYLLSPLKAGGVVDGELIGSNISMPYFAQRLGRYLEQPVIDQTGLAGSYDFHLPPVDPTNHDTTSGLLEAVSRLGLKLKGGKAPVEIIVIDSVIKPTAD